MGDDTLVSDRVIATIACDLERSPIGTASRLLRDFGGRSVLRRAVEAVAAVGGIERIVLLAPAAQMERIRGEVGGIDDGRVCVMELLARPQGLDARIRRGRMWDLVSWRGGAGQWTVFDEDYHPQAVAEAAKATGAEHVLCVPAHGALLDAGLLAALVHHHLHKNNEMKFTYTPAAPGLCGIVLRAGVVAEMAAVGGGGVTPGMLLGYDPKAPNFDSLIRDACMQVDPALSKIQNRFLLDTERGWGVAEGLRERMPFESAATIALAARDLPVETRAALPREVEIELTGRRRTHPPGCVPAMIREGRGELDAGRWVEWMRNLLRPRDCAPNDEGQPKGCTPKWDDLLVTFCGDGDPLMYGGLLGVLEAARGAGVAGICVQTDLLAGTDVLIEAANRGLVDVISVQCYGDDAATYAKVSGIDGYADVMAGLMKLAPVAAATATLVVPRLLKVRETIPQMEAFFDKWILQGCWVVIDGPTDRAGGVPFAGVVDMAPPKRRPCRRIADRMLIRASGTAVACDQDMNDRLALGNIEGKSLAELWRGMNPLRELHADGKWSEVTPCGTCREWHRA